MSYGFLDIAVTPGVRTAPAAMGVDRIWEGSKGHRPSDRFTAAEVAFIAARDSFYMANVSETGWPYVRHRGGPPNFLKQIDDRTLAFADRRGNRHYISVGNLAANDRACLFPMDDGRRARLKIYARAKTVALDADPELTRLAVTPEVRGKPERIMRLNLEAFDWNCPQPITPRFARAEIGDAIQPIRERLARLQGRERRPARPE